MALDQSTDTGDQNINRTENQEVTISQTPSSDRAPISPDNSTKQVTNQHDTVTRIIKNAQNGVKWTVRRYRQKAGTCRRDFPWLPEGEARLEIFDTAAERAGKDLERFLRDKYPKAEDFISFFDIEKPVCRAKPEIDKDTRTVYVNWEVKYKEPGKGIIHNGRGEGIKADLSILYPNSSLKPDLLSDESEFPPLSSGLSVEDPFGELSIDENHTVHRWR